LNLINREKFEKAHKKMLKMLKGEKGESLFRFAKKCWVCGEITKEYIVASEVCEDCRKTYTAKELSKLRQDYLEEWKDAKEV